MEMPLAALLFMCAKNPRAPTTCDTLACTCSSPAMASTSWTGWWAHTTGSCRRRTRAGERRGALGCSCTRTNAVPAPRQMKGKQQKSLIVCLLALRVERSETSHLLAHKGLSTTISTITRARAQSQRLKKQRRGSRQWQPAQNSAFAPKQPAAGSQREPAGVSAGWRRATAAAVAGWIDAFLALFAGFSALFAGFSALFAGRIGGCLALLDCCQAALRRHCAVARHRHQHQHQHQPPQQVGPNSCGCHALQHNAR